MVRDLKARPHHKQGAFKGFEAALRPATDSLQRSVATTVWFAGMIAVFSAPEIDHSTDSFKISEVFPRIQYYRLRASTAIFITSLLRLQAANHKNGSWLEDGRDVWATLIRP